jgi:rhodanese-related sulfurtransferase
MHSQPITPLHHSHTRRLGLAACLAFGLLSSSAHADEAAVSAMAEYLEFQDYGGGVIFAEQIPAEQWKKTFVIDARDAGQFSKGHIDGAVNIEWRQVLAEKSRIPKDRMVLLYCNTGSLSAQAGFALRVAGYDNVRILQGGYEEWKAKGGFDANARAAGKAPAH